MAHEDIIGMQQHLDIIGAQGGFNNQRYLQNQQCPPQMMRQPPASVGGPYGFTSEAMARANEFFPGKGSMPGVAYHQFGYGGDFPYGSGWPGGNPEAWQQLQEAYGPCAFPPWPGCFGPPPNPLLIQKTLQPARWVEPRCPTDIRTELVGLGEECIGPCETVKIECDVCATTKIYSIVIPWDICDLVVIEDIRVQKDSVVNGCSGIPGCMFAPDANNNFHVDWPTINEGSCFELVVRNISDAKVCFRAGAWAAVIRY